MVGLKGSLRERLEEAVRLVCTEVSEDEVAGFIALYEKAGVKLLPSAVDFFKQYGGAYRNSYIMLKDPKFNKEVSLNCFGTITDFYYSYAYDPKEIEKDMLRRLDWAMDDIDMVKEFAKQEVGKDGRLYCVYDFKEEIDVFHTPAEILESYLGNNPPIGVDWMPVKTKYDWEEDSMYRIEADNFKLDLAPMVHEEDLSCPVNTSLRVEVFSYSFSADSLIDIDVHDLGRFAIQLNDLYKNLKGIAKLEAPYGDSQILLSASAGGHIRISGCIDNEDAYGYRQKLFFENEIDQTYIKDFAKALFAAFRGYAE